MRQMLASAFLTYSYIFHSKFKLQSLCGNSSTACCWQWCTWRSQDIAAQQGEPGVFQGTNLYVFKGMFLYGPDKWHRSCHTWGTHKAWMQLNVIHLLETALVKVANSQGSLHYLSPAALEPPFQSVFFPQSSSDANQNQWQGMARVNTDRVLWDTCPLLTSLTEWCGVWPADGDDCQLTLSMRRNFRIILSAAAWISYTGYAKTPVHMNIFRKSLHLDPVTPSESPKL